VGLWLDDTINQPVIDNLYYQYHLFAEKLTTEKKLRSVFIHKAGVGAWRCGAYRPRAPQAYSKYAEDARPREVVQIQVPTPA
jgi:hypothetical protein